jgi:hypothetical protein
MARTPAVSVILPARNAERFVGEAVDSILNQRFDDFELIVVDDGSVDGTRRIVESYRDGRIRIIGNPQPLGLTQSLNRALAVASGEFIARQDADDISEPERLAEQVAHLQQHQDVVLIGSWFTAIDASGAVIRHTRLPVDDVDVRWAMFFYCPFVHGAVVWRRVAVRDAVGGYDERFAYAQDHDLWRRIASRFSVGNLPRFLVRYREHPQSMTSEGGERTLEGVTMHLDAIGSALSWHGLVHAERQARFGAMAALLRESQALDLAPTVAARAVDDLLRLQSRMCDREQLDLRTATQHRRALRAAVSRGLVRIARRSADGRRPIEAGRLLAAAYRLYWPTLADRSAARLAARVVRDTAAGAA